MICATCSSEDVTITMIPDRTEPANLVECQDGECRFSEWMTTETLNNIFAMERDVLRVTKPEEAAAWERWAKS